ncbi:MAG: NrdH-redoxin [Candidatus Portnoybacteria bacterium CG_4_8_14_3_um_filter_44_15]|uniref:NrdH-redoxin n=4 Tax=Candidatus Portnoyibacteriota TaxID=1817913 RepID=A0A2M7YM37_9BACT|nr:MAG: NrdH-redoxin [Parcubacteria group bacterium CG1_02_44_65]PIP15495.1 MAG: NrdH-redoxin [Candidatus Portnoybacteria bacterium CG23_combo_of_CG06-09_8_20_14_all_44_36]PIW74597.1 MAG: NrdH-redoxin [Candidatus Portnoybacteria bacterium CG_4_8_14_3_um_filter_44_15]PIZ69158.1 MAG: NrdH-redoxin [Candidatus Portnoybacteria bacterium CG_4_10_14_0_2_um_filter_43_36]PJA64051.1 MAG: NrdH-redoxin [Candidatus Portnoybacteria bacterium CG_4_9_14_3_um_filter_43_11]PJE59021.1 MAG: NrdH-redoxin [Candidat
MEETRKEQPAIRVFSTPSCPYCVNLKQYLDEKGFKYEDIDVAEDEKAREEMISKSKQMGVPVAEINGEIVVGFDKAKIDQLLGIKE